MRYLRQIRQLTEYVKWSKLTFRGCKALISTFYTALKGKMVFYRVYIRKSAQIRVME